jgi:hypothetical protein
MRNVSKHGLTLLPSTQSIFYASSLLHEHVHKHAQSLSLSLFQKLTRTLSLYHTHKIDNVVGICKIIQIRAECNSFIGYVYFPYTKKAGGIMLNQERQKH